MTIPFVDLKSQYLSIKTEIDKAIADVIANTAFIGGPYVQQFEADFSAYCGCTHVIACANGTDSLEILLQCMGVGRGDEVLVPASSWISTSEAVSNIGATPVFVDIEPDFFTIDPELIEEKITSKTKAIIPVHLYGQAANMPRIMQIANKHNLKVLEDCAQSHGAEIQGQKTGTFGHCASFSFYPGKNLGAYGDAGAMVTNDDAIAEKARMIANHGQQGKHNHMMEGRNSRLDGLNAAVLSAKLPHVEKWTAARIKNAACYLEQLANNAVKAPATRENSKHVFHLFVIRTEKRDALIAHLKKEGIETAIHYPVALPFLPCYEYQQHKPGDFPVAYEYMQQIVSLPMYPELTEEMIKTVSKSINVFETSKLIKAIL
jgi:dTDP-4-amino-4,6-dideoxygalactose transaminase